MLKINDINNLLLLIAASTKVKVQINLSKFTNKFYFCFVITLFKFYIFSKNTKDGCTFLNMNASFLKNNKPNVIFTVVLVNLLTFLFPNIKPSYH